MSPLAIYKIYFIAFGVFAILGGLIGFLKAKSTASLIAGGISGIALIALALLHASQPQVSLYGTLTVSVLLAGRFLPAFLKTRKPMPAGVMALLSIVGILLDLLLLFR